MPILLQLQKLPWKGDGGWKKWNISASFFGWPEDREFVEFFGGGHPKAQATSYCLFPDTFWLWASKNAFNDGSVKFTNSLPLWRKYAPEVKAAKGLKRCRAKIRGVNNPAWIAQCYHSNCKQSRSICRKCKWGVTAKHTGTLCTWLWMKCHCKLVHDCMVYTKPALRWQQLHVVSAMEDPNSSISTLLWWRFKNTIKRLKSLIWNQHMREIISAQNM